MSATRRAAAVPEPVRAALAAASGPVAVVRVAERTGLAAVVAGELSVHTGDAVVGELLGGAVQDEVAALGAAAVSGRVAQQREVVVSEAAAVGAGLGCAGRALLVAHPLTAAAAHLLADGLTSGAPVLLAGGADSGSGAALVASGWALEDRVGTVFDGSGPLVDDAVLQRARELLTRAVSATDQLQVAGGSTVLLDLWVPVARMVLVGAGVLAAALTEQADVLGWVTETVTTPAQAEATVATLTGADALVLLDHSPDFDTALLACARGPAFTGALGSRHTQSDRAQRLRAAGATEDDLTAVRGPVGLDLGARTPAETAVSIVAEVLAARSGRSPAALGSSSGRIGT